MTCSWCRSPAHPGERLCSECLRDAAHDIGALPLDVRDLAALLPAEGGPQQRVSGTRAPSVPIDLHADALIRAIVWQLGVWEPPVREAAGLDPAPDHEPPERLTNRASRCLSAHVDAFSRLPPTWGYPCGIEVGCVARSGLYGLMSLRRCHERALAALDLLPPTLHLPGRCETCGAAALLDEPGTPRIRCAHCHHTINTHQYLATIGISPSPEQVKSPRQPQNNPPPT